jgi:hypothetical protein
LFVPSRRDGAFVVLLRRPPSPRGNAIPRPLRHTARAERETDRLHHSTARGTPGLAERTVVAVAECRCSGDPTIYERVHDLDVPVLDELSPELLAADAEADAYLAAKYEELGIVPGA